MESHESEYRESGQGWARATRNPEALLRDDIVVALGTYSDANSLGLRVDQLYGMADAVVAEASKTDRLVNQGRVFRVEQADWLDADELGQSFTIYTAPNPEPTP